MAVNYEFLIRNRDYESEEVFKGIKIIKWLDTPYNQLLEEALDQYYFENLLVDGQCKVCQTKTSTFCANCGTHYCSITCQTTDWPSHVSTCFRFECEADVLDDSTVEKSAPSVTDKKLLQMPESTDVINVNKPLMDINLKTFRESKVDRNVTQAASDIDTSSSEKNSVLKDRKVSNKKQRRWFPNKRHNQKLAESNKNKLKEAKKKDDKIVEKSKDNSGLQKKIFWTYKEGQEIRVKCMDRAGNLCIAIEEGNIEKLNAIKEKLQSECDKYALAYESEIKKGDIYGVWHQKKWQRGKILAIEGEEPKYYMIVFIDSTHFQRMKFDRFKVLPRELLENRHMVFRIRFEEGEIPKLGSVFNIVILGIEKNVYLVKRCEDKKENDSVTQSKKKKSNEKKEDIEGKTRKSYRREWVIETMTDDTTGLFVPMIITKECMLGSFILNSNDEKFIQTVSIINNLHATNCDIIDGKVGEDVMLEYRAKFHRGVVLSKSPEGYTVRLIDFGNNVEVKKVYQLPEEAAKCVELGCRVSVSDGSSTAFTCNTPVTIKVLNRLENDWECEIYSQSKVKHSGIIGRIMKPKKARLKNVPMTNGMTVTISCVSDDNVVYLQHASIFMQKKLEELSLLLNTDSPATTKSDIDNSTLNLGQIVKAQYIADKLWYRGKIIFKSKTTIRVFFVDYGNIQICSLDEMRKLPDELMEFPIFATKVQLSGPRDSFSVQGRKYLAKISAENKPLTLKFDGKKLEDGVILTDDAGVEVNEIAFMEGEEEKRRMTGFFNSTTAPYSFPLGRNDEFVLLHIDEYNFKDSGLFWGGNGGDENYSYVIKTMGLEINRHCESDPNKEYFPKPGEYCLAKFEGLWYRALAKSCTGSTISVFFIDFGNTESVKSFDIRRMVPEFESPPVAGKCVLYGFEKFSEEEIEICYCLLMQSINKKVSITVEEIVDNVHFVQFDTSVFLEGQSSEVY